MCVKGIKVTSGMSACTDIVRTEKKQETQFSQNPVIHVSYILHLSRSVGVLTAPQLNDSENDLSVLGLNTAKQ